MPGAAANQMALIAALSGDDCRIIDELAWRTALTRKQVSLAATGLITRGYLERVETGCFRLTAAGSAFKASGQTLRSGPSAPLNQVCRRPKRTTQRDLFWRALRIMNKATIGDLCEAAEINQESGYTNALRFVWALEKTGFLRRLPQRAPGTALTSNGFLRWQLLPGAGPKTPVVRGKAREVYDPNTGQTHSWEPRS